eukprot:scaffold14.g1291.t1
MGEACDTRNAPARPPLAPLEQGVELELHKYFRIVKELGRGSYSRVYKVQRLSDGQLYALKLTETQSLSFEDQQLMLEEIRLLSALKHPNIVRYHEAFVDHRRLCVVMQLVKGGDLTSILQKRARVEDPLTEREVWNYLLQAALGLQDMKPQNLLVGDDGVLRISDLGVSQEMGRVFTRLDVGTPQPLFFTEQTKTEEDVKQLVLSGRVPVLPGRYSLSLRQLVSLLLHPDPAHRPTIDEVLSMPTVQASMDCLPPALRTRLASAAAEDAAVEAVHHSGSGTHLVLADPIPLLGPGMSMDWLNCWMPPAQYDDRQAGVAEDLKLRSGRRCRSWGGLATARLERAASAPSTAKDPAPFITEGHPRSTSTADLGDFCSRAEHLLQHRSEMVGEMQLLAARERERGEQRGGAGPAASPGGSAHDGLGRVSAAPMLGDLEPGLLRRYLHHEGDAPDRTRAHQAVRELPPVRPFERAPFQFLAAPSGGAARSAGSTSAGGGRSPGAAPAAAPAANPAPPPPPASPSPAHAPSPASAPACGTEAATAGGSTDKKKKRGRLWRLFYGDSHANNEEGGGMHQPIW